MKIAEFQWGVAADVVSHMLYSNPLAENKSKCNSSTISPLIEPQ